MSHAYLLDAADEQWPNILMFYKVFEERKPVMLYDIQGRKIYAYPYAEFLKDLSAKSQALLKKQYQEALKENKIVVFVRDNEQKRLVSFARDYE
jgi:hypothetical protein